MKTSNAREAAPATISEGFEYWLLELAHNPPKLDYGSAFKSTLKALAAQHNPGWLRGTYDSAQATGDKLSEACLNLMDMAEAALGKPIDHSTVPAGSWVVYQIDLFREAFPGFPLTESLTADTL